MQDIQLESQSTATTALEASSNPKREVFQEDAISRLQQAAHILVNGAIRAAQKQQVALNEQAKADKPTFPVMSDIQTSPDFCLEAKEKSVSRSGKKPSQMPCPAKAYERKPNGIKDFGSKGVILGNMS